MNVKEFREQNPQYEDLSNADLGFGLWNKHYKDDMNAWEFAETFGLNADDVASMRQQGLDQGLSEVDIAGELAETDVDVAEPTAFVNSQTLGLGDVVSGAIMATQQKLSDPNKDWSELYSKNKKYARDQLNSYREQYPTDALKTELMGGLASPLAAVKLPGFLGSLPTTMQAMLRGFTEGTIYGVNEAQDNKMAKGLETGVVSAFMTGGMDRLIRTLKPASKTVKSLMSLRKNPTVANLKVAKQAAYEEVDKMGGIFGVDDIKSIWRAGDTAAASGLAYNPTLDKTVKTIEKTFRKYVNKRQVFKLTELDNIRKDLFKRQANANENEKLIIGKMIDQLDNVIHSKPVEGAAMKLARSLHGKYMKTKQLDDAFNAARRSATATGSGGNIFNLYKQSVKNILNNPKKMKFFDEVETAAMEAFLKGPPTEKMMRILSKASPTGNGLIFVLTAGAATQNPAALALSAAGYAADRSLKKGIQKKAGQLIDDIGTGFANKAPPAPLPGIPTLMSVTAGSPAALNNPAEGLIGTMPGTE